MGQEYHLSFHDLVPCKGTGKLKQIPENLVNKSEEWHGNFNLGVLVKFVKKFLKVHQYSQIYSQNTLVHQNTHYLCSKFCSKYATVQQTSRAVLITAHLPMLEINHHHFFIKISISSIIGNTSYFTSELTTQMHVSNTFKLLIRRAKKNTSTVSL